MYLFQCRQTSIHDAPLGFLLLMCVVVVVVDESPEGKKEYRRSLSSGMASTRLQGAKALVLVNLSVSFLFLTGWHVQNIFGCFCCVFNGVGGRMSVTRRVEV